MVLLDGLSVVRAHQPFRRAESKYVLERLGISVSVSVGVLSGLVLNSRTARAIRAVRYPLVSAPGGLGC